MPAITEKSLREERAALVAELGELDSQLNAKPDAELQTRFDAKDAEVRAKDAQIVRYNRLNGLVGDDLDTDDADHRNIGNEDRDGEKREKDDPVHAPPANYRLLRAINRLYNGQHIDGLEGEISQEIAKRYGKDPNGFFMPFNLRLNALSGREYRDLDTTTGTGGTADNFQPQRFIDLLRKRMVLSQCGARVITGVTGATFTMPKQTAAATAYYVTTEGNQPTSSNQTLGNVQFTPTTLGVKTKITRQFAKQTSLDAEMIVRSDQNTVLRLELDRAGLNGSGASGQPTGLLQDAGVETIAIGTNGGAPTWAKVVEMETGVASDSADVDAMAYISTPQAVGAFKTTEKAASTAQFLMANGQMNGFDVKRTAQLPSNLTKGSGTALSATLFGDYTTCMYAMWGGIDVYLDQVTEPGNTIVTMLVDYDFQLRHDESVTKCVDLVTS